MTRYFNTEGACNPREHYMVKLDERIAKIKRLFVDRKKYFVINRGRQYGKTTTLKALAKELAKDYLVFALDFQKFETGNFENAVRFAKAFVKKLSIAIGNAESENEKELKKLLLNFQNDLSDTGMDALFMCLSNLCEKSSRPIVLIIDEVDSASNNQVFIDFLAQLRGYYLEREDTPIFHSVILAGVYDIKNLKLKLRPDAEHKYNSPWNTREGNEGSECLHSLNDCSRDQIALVQFDIVAKFTVDMSFSASQIASMLEEYETDNHIGMDIQLIAEEIYQYTSGYPYLVSAICKCLDEELSEEWGEFEKAWSKEGVAEAVKKILKGNPPLFGSMAKQLDTYPDLRNMIEDIIYRGKRIPFSPEEKSINLGIMFGYLKEVNGQVAMSNRIFEMCLLNMFMAEESGSDAYTRGDIDSIQFIKDKRLDMELVLKKFAEYFNDIYGDNDWKFVESQGRKLFLLYLKPIINGTGNYYIEAQTRDARRTDVIVDYLGEQFIVELKIWHGNEYNERGEQQLTDYLEYYHKEKGYMLSFNFNKNKTAGVKEIQVGGKTIVEVVV